MSEAGMFFSFQPNVCYSIPNFKNHGICTLEWVYFVLVVTVTGGEIHSKLWGNINIYIKWWSNFNILILTDPNRLCSLVSVTEFLYFMFKFCKTSYLIDTEWNIKIVQIYSCYTVSVNENVTSFIHITLSSSSLSCCIVESLLGRISSLNASVYSDWVPV